MKKFPRIVFIGSTPFSLFSLKELSIRKYNIVGIITNPDSIFNKNKRNTSVKKYALENHIPILQPKNLIDPFFLKNLKIWNADIQIIVSFRILPKEVWGNPKMGTLNLHASFLPQYRGAAPINWAIINGENKTGLTTFFVNNQVDYGKILLQKEIKIEKEETAGELENKLKKFSGSMIIKTLEGILQKKIKPKIQKYIISSPLKYAPKISPIDCRIFWKENSIEVIYNKIRGLSPYPTAWTFLFFNEKIFVRFKIFIVKKIREIHSFPIGFVILSSYEMKISVKEGFISIIEGQIEGKKKMDIKNLINGIKIRKNLFVR
ncbi:methionyl-tRNA formyltransferase [Blattabacterium sp. (Cryptocercus kyebangensis)]|uniref:methionyl-tRNA formyltransferase n=1 Tax=Blattabacterium sp. (Cryptocercus kyebangensis) TaxID=298656 RepID=UPI000D7BFA0E|nr:methionyl-tRNA formyltransferase [Blattabacterium sp. (Cryptocercus kyebangensis)]AWU43526.1 methionyl-tRNA formyltransferase [Blattabacterium sp. (Cryptocercus kyebangensis)]